VLCSKLLIVLWDEPQRCTQCGAVLRAAHSVVGWASKVHTVWCCVQSCSLSCEMSLEGAHIAVLCWELLIESWDEPQRCTHCGAVLRAVRWVVRWASKVHTMRCCVESCSLSCVMIKCWQLGSAYLYGRHHKQTWLGFTLCFCHMSVIRWFYIIQLCGTE